MRRNLTIVFTILLCVIISISCVAFGILKTMINRRKRCVVKSCGVWKEYGKSDIIALVDEGPLTDEYYFDEGSLIVKGN